MTTAITMLISISDRQKSLSIALPSDPQCCWVIGRNCYVWSCNQSYVQLPYMHCSNNLRGHSGDDAAVPQWRQSFCGWTRVGFYLLENPSGFGANLGLQIGETASSSHSRWLKRIVHYWALHYRCLLWISHIFLSFWLSLTAVTDPTSRQICGSGHSRCNWSHFGHILVDLQ